MRAYHPRDRLHTYPIPPRERINAPRWAGDYAQFLAILSAKELVLCERCGRDVHARQSGVGAALTWIHHNGFAIALDDVPEEYRAACKAFVASRSGPDERESILNVDEWLS